MQPCLQQMKFSLRSSRFFIPKGNWVDVSVGIEIPVWPLPSINYFCQKVAFFVFCGRSGQIIKHFLFVLKLVHTLAIILANGLDIRVRDMGSVNVAVATAVVVVYRAAFKESVFKVRISLWLKER